MLAVEIEEIKKSLASEGERSAYPPEFPALPEVPAGRYTDQAFYDLEMEHVWKKTWLCVGHVSELPNPGSFKLFNKVGVAILVIRGRDGEVRAFHNACRHRGSALVFEPEGRAALLTCPYHAWTYDTAGALVKVPGEEDFACFNRSEKGLVPVRCEVWRGLIYINLDAEAQPLVDYLGEIIPKFAEFPLEKLVVRHRFSGTVECNWKAMLDNFWESYHVSTLHAKTVGNLFDDRAYFHEHYANGHIRTLQRLNAKASASGPPFPRNIKGLSSFHDSNVLGLGIFPNQFFTALQSGVTWTSSWPDGKGRAVVEGFVLGSPEVDDAAADAEYWKMVATQSEAVLAEDLKLLSSIQRSLEGGGFTGMVLGFKEKSLYWYNEEIDRRIGPDNIPASLRVKQVLEPFRNDRPS